jgi:hypothetical protein
MLSSRSESGTARKLVPHWTHHGPTEWLWTDMLPEGGGTFVAADSVPVVARFLADHPEGMLPGHFDYAGLIRKCRDFAEMAGKAGDVVLRQRARAAAKRAA